MNKLQENMRRFGTKNLQEQGKLSAIKSKLKAKFGKEDDVESKKEPVVLTRDQQDENWKKQNCNDTNSVLGKGSSIDMSMAKKKATFDARVKLNAIDGHEGPVAITDSAMWQQADGGYYCLTCMTKHSNL